jgi:hypothetical protein
MKERRKRFKEAMNQARAWSCEACPCYKACQDLKEKERGAPCYDVLFFYVETGEKENFLKYLL